MFIALTGTSMLSSVRMSGNRPMRTVLGTILTPLIFSSSTVRMTVSPKLVMFMGTVLTKRSESSVRLLAYTVTWSGQNCVRAR